MPTGEPSGEQLPDCFRVAWAGAAERLGRDVAVVAPGAAVRLTDRGADALDALVAGATIGDAGVVAGTDVRPLVRLLLDAGLAHPRPAGCRFSATDVSVVVPARDAAEHLDRLLPLLRPSRVVVVDDASRDETADVAARHGATVLRSTRSGGPAAARNRGVDAATTPLVAFVDADCAPRRGWLETLTRHFDDPLVAAAAPRIVPITAEGPLLTRYEAARSVLDRGPDEARVAPDAPLRLVPTAALVARRSALVGVGGLDPDLRFGEDQDLVYRLTAGGWRIRYDPAAEVAHDHRTTFGAFVARRAAYGTPAGRLARRHGPLEAAARLPSPALLAAGRELVAMGAPGGTAAAVIRRAALHHARSVGNAATRAWLVPAGVAATRSRRVAIAVGAAVAARHVADWRRRRPPVPLPAWVALRVVDEGALAAGIWWGAVRARTTLPLRPTFATTFATAPPDGLLVESIGWIP